MLVRKMNLDDELLIGGKVRVKVLGVSRGSLRIGVAGPDSVSFEFITPKPRPAIALFNRLKLAGGTRDAA